MPQVAIASISPLAAGAGARVADEGGNAADSAIAAALASAVTAPGLCSLGGAGFAIIGPPDGPAEAIDGGFEMPGRGLPPDRFGAARMDVHLEYGGGVDTTVGPGSVATPGALALCALASERHGRLPWAALVEPSIEFAQDGFPLPKASNEYLTFSHESIFGWNDDSFAALHDEHGELLATGATVRVPHLSASLRRIADVGAQDFYVGDVGETIARHVTDSGGLLSSTDLASYQAVVRSPIGSAHSDWQISTNPPPAVGGAVLAVMLRLLEGQAEVASAQWAAKLARVQEAVLLYRSCRLEASDELAVEAERLLGEAASGSLRLPGAPSTVHTSAVDEDGLACSITLSDGYGSGVVAPGTGIWLNNCLGEPELNPQGYHGWPPGHRLLSNMAPTVARHRDGSVLAIGSPGADRITTALAQVLINFFELGMPLQTAVDHPRLHVELTDEGPRIAYEPQVPTRELPFPGHPYDEPSMFFGGVSAALWNSEGGFELGSDGRRVGGVAIGGE